MFGHKNTVFFVFIIFLVSGETKVFGLRRHFTPNRRSVYSYADMSKLAQRSTFVKPEMEPSPENGDISDEEVKVNARKMQRSSRRLESNDAEEVHETKMAKSSSRYKAQPPQEDENVKYPSFPYARSFISIRNATMDDYNEPRNPPEYYEKIWNSHLDSFQGTSTDLQGSSYNTPRRSKVSPERVDELSHKTPDISPYAPQKQSVDYSVDTQPRESEPISEHGERTLETNAPTNGTEVSPDITTHDIPAPEVEKVKKYVEFPVDEFEKQFNSIKLEKHHGKQLLDRLRDLLDVSKNPYVVYTLKDADMDASAPIHTRLFAVLNRLSQSERIKDDQRHDVKHALKYLLQPTNVSLDFKNMVGVSHHFLDEKEIEKQSNNVTEAVKLYKTLIEHHLNSLLQHYGRDFQEPSPSTSYEKIIAFFNHVTSPTSTLPRRYKNAINTIIPFIRIGAFNEATDTLISYRMGFVPKYVW